MEKNKILKDLKKELDKVEIVDLKEKKYDTEIENVYIHKGCVVAETKSSILCKIGKYKIWFNKKFVRFSNYTLRLNIGIILNYEYACETANNEAAYITGKNLIKFFNPEEKEETNE